MFVDKTFRQVIDSMFIPPQDYDSIKVETRETPEEPILIITLYRNQQIIFFHNYEYESAFLDAGRCVEVREE